jgi:hypothetical protein
LRSGLPIQQGSLGNLLRISHCRTSDQIVRHAALRRFVALKLSSMVASAIIGRARMASVLVAKLPTGDPADQQPSGGLRAR